MNSEQTLTGGGMSSVWRVGDTVHRDAGPWTPQVHKLLERLHARGVTCVPAPLGMDEAGREVLTYLPGEVGASPLAAPHRSDAVIVQAARLLHHSRRDGKTTQSPIACNPSGCILGSIGLQ